MGKKVEVEADGYLPGTGTAAVAPLLSALLSVAVRVDLNVPRELNELAAVAAVETGLVQNTMNTQAATVAVVVAMAALFSYLHEQQLPPGFRATCTMWVRS